jgi:hypothetical protein
MRVLFKMQDRLRREVIAALSEPHPFAAERVAFLKCRVSSGVVSLIILAHEVHHVDDDDYLNDPSAGATMGPAAIRNALQVAYQQDTSMFHVHLHCHTGRPGFSRTDFRESALFVPDFWNVRPALPHGAIVLSEDSGWGRCWYPGHKEPTDITDFSFVGMPMRCTWKDQGKTRV